MKWILGLIFSVFIVCVANAYLSPLSSTFTTGLFSNGTMTAPSVSFTNDTASGMYLKTAGSLAMSVGGATALDFKLSSPGGFGNAGMGGDASTADTGILTMTRSNPSAVTTVYLSNSDTGVNSTSQFQAWTDGGNEGAVLGAYAANSTVAPYISAAVLRPAGNAIHLSLMGGNATGGDVGIWTGNDFTATGITANFNTDHSVTFKGLLQLPVQAASSTPTCGSPQSGSLALTSLYKLCVCNGSAWKNASDGSTACTF